MEKNGTQFSSQMAVSVASQPLSRAPQGMKRGGKLKARASNETNDVKDRIQALVREIVIARDGGCILDPAY
jgi:hypothetical protein